MPVPSGKLKAEMLLGGHIVRIEAEQTDRQEDCPDHNVRTVEAGRHKEGRSVQRSIKCELSFWILIDLQAGEGEAENNR